MKGDPIRINVAPILRTDECYGRDKPILDCLPPFTEVIYDLSGSNRFATVWIFFEGDDGYPRRFTLVKRGTKYYGLGPELKITSSRVHNSRLWGRRIRRSIEDEAGVKVSEVSYA